MKIPAAEAHVSCPVKFQYNLTAEALTARNREVKQYHRSCSGNNGSPRLAFALAPTAIASASPPATTSLLGTTTPAIPASPEPSYSSFSAITHKSKNIIFSKAKRGRKTPTATTRSKRNYGSFSHLAEISKERKKNSVSLLTLAEALYLSHSWLKTRKRRKKRLCFSLCFAENLSHSLCLG